MLTIIIAIMIQVAAAAAAVISLFVWLYGNTYMSHLTTFETIAFWSVIVLLLSLWAYGTFLLFRPSELGRFQTSVVVGLLTLILAALPWGASFAEETYVDKVRGTEFAEQYEVKKHALLDRLERNEPYGTTYEALDFPAHVKIIGLYDKEKFEEGLSLIRKAVGKNIIDPNMRSVDPTSFLYGSSLCSYYGNMLEHPESWWDEEYTNIIRQLSGALACTTE
jgi:hypothetical protein